MRFNAGKRKDAIARGRRAEERAAGGGFITLYQKELADHFRSCPLQAAVRAFDAHQPRQCLFGAFDALVNSQTSEYVFLSMYTSSGSSIPSFASFLAYLTPLVGLALGFDAINSERAQGTLTRLISQPIHRDAVILRQIPGGGRGYPAAGVL